MKVCPICDTKFDDEVIRFCTKDGSPLVDDSQPNFMEMPSESLEELEDDQGEVTVIRKNEPPPKQPPPIDELELPPLAPAERFVVHTEKQAQQREPQIRQRNQQAYYPPPPPPTNTLRTVALTVLGTVIVLGIGAFLYSMFQSDRAVNANVNLNTNLGSFNGNLNNNFNLNNFNFNTQANFNSNFNSNINFNANLKTPTPTPKPSPTASPTPTATLTPSPTPHRTLTNARPSASPTPRMGPRPTPNPNRLPANN